MTSKTKSILKYLFAILLLVLILHKTDVGKIVGYFKQIPAINLILALTAAICGQLFAALRMRYFFHASEFHLSKKYAVILYYVGSFYNFLLPGGIGGDAYKVMIARKRLEMPTSQGIRIMLADRASGLCVLMFMLFITLYIMDISKVIAYANILLLLASFITLICYLIGSKLLLKQHPKTMLLSLPFSLVSQLLWVFTLAALWKSLGNGSHFIEYTTLYCSASIASLIPLSVGGLGIKEMTYFYGAKMIDQYTGVPIDGDLGVALSLCLFALTFVSSLPGVLWLHKITHLDHK